MTTLLAGTSTTASTTITTTTPSELAHFTATSPTVGCKRHYVLTCAVLLSVRPLSVIAVGGRFVESSITQHALCDCAEIFWLDIYFSRPLACGEVDLSSLRRFLNSIAAKVLVRFCRLNFIYVRHSLLMSHLSHVIEFYCTLVFLHNIVSVPLALLL